MKNFLIYFFSVVIAFTASFSLIWLWIPIYEWINPQEGDVQALWGFLFFVISLATFIITAMFLPDILKTLLNREDRLWKRIKKSFPYWAEPHIEKGLLTVSWFQGYRNSPEAVNNYRFDFKNNQARFYQSADKDNVFFEGTVNQGVSSLLKK